MGRREGKEGGREERRGRREEWGGGRGRRGKEEGKVKWRQELLLSLIATVWG